MDAIVQDLRYAARGLRKTPIFTAAAVLTLALGIGATTAIFSVIYGVMFRPLPYRDPSRLVRLSAEGLYGGQWYEVGYSAVELPELREQLLGLASIAAYSTTTYALYDGQGTLSMPGAYVTGNFFELTGGRSTVGRFFTEADAHEPVVVISEKLWRRQFGADPDVVGMALTLGDIPFTVVGVASTSFELPDGAAEIWTPIECDLTAALSRAKDPNSGGFTLIGRLRGEISLSQAQREVVGAATMAEPVPFAMSRRPTVSQLSDHIVGDVRTSLVLLFAAVCLVLLVACINVTNLCITRNIQRSRELAVLLALGAPTRRLLSRSGAEVLLLGVWGAIGAMLVAQGALALLAHVEPTGIPRLSAVGLDAPVLAFALATTMFVLTSVIIGSAWSTGVREPLRLLQAGGRGVAGGIRSRRARTALVIGEFVACFVLIVCATLLARSLFALLRTNIGIATDDVVTVYVDLNLGKPDAPRIGGLREVTRVNEVTRQLGLIPGVLASGFATSLPAELSRMRAGISVADPLDGMKKDVFVDIVPITDTYFDALSIRLLSGRLFTDSDGMQTPTVAVLSATASRVLFGSESPVGNALSVPFRAQPLTVVGVVADVKYSALASALPDTPAIYVPYAQRPFRVGYFFLRTVSDADTVLPRIAPAIASIDPHIAVTEIRSMDQVIRSGASSYRTRAAAFVSLAILAVVLAAVGLFGVIADTVSQQTREIGIRLALGETGAGATVAVLRDAAWTALMGVAGGVCAAAAVSRVLSGMLYGVTANDPWSFVCGAAVLMCVTLAASYLPARRAARVDPIVALRAE